MISIVLLAAIVSAEVPCKGICSCSKQTINCADANILNLTWTFPNDVKKIILKNNKLQRLDCLYAWPESLEYLDLSYNKISDFCFHESLKSLIYLDMRWNPFNYSFSEDVFKPLLSLKTLKMKRKIKYDDPSCSGQQSVMTFEALTVLHSLTVLIIDLSPNIIFAHNFSKMKNLTTLDLSCNISYDNEHQIFCLHNPQCCARYIRADTFSNLTFVTNLTINDCDLRSIEKGAFGIMNSLKYLNISNNIHLTFSPLQNLTWNMNNTKIEILDLSTLHCSFSMSTELCDRDFVGLQETNLKQLYLNSNNLRKIHKKSLLHLPISLQRLSLKDNVLVLGVFMITTSHLTNLTEIDVSQQPGININVISEVLIECPGHSHKCSANVHKERKLNVYMENISISYLSPPDFSFHIPQNLKRVKASYLNLNMDIPEIKFTDPNNVESISMSSNLFFSWTGPIGPLNNLTFLDLSENYCRKIGPNFFKEMENLKELHIQGNILGGHVASNWFNYLTKLEILNMSSNLLPYLPKHIFQNQKSMRILNISKNNLNRFHVYIKHMKNLELLLLSGNYISNLSDEFMYSVDKIWNKNKKLQVDLTQNPFDCSCKNLNALKWFQTRTIIFKNLRNFTCVFANKTQGSFQNLHFIISELENTCSDYSMVLLLTLFFVALLLAFIAFPFAYRYRWKIRYLYHMFRANNQSKMQTTNDFKYDAFISYAEEQSKFVTVDMIQHLELEFGLRLCLHQRDFVPGKSIATNITSSVHQSQRTVLVLSQSFVESYWCMFEFQMAKMEGMYARSTDNIIFVIIYEHVPLNKLPLNLLNVISTQSFIEFPGEEQGNIVFWNKLADALIT